MCFATRVGGLNESLARILEFEADLTEKIAPTDDELRWSEQDLGRADFLVCLYDSY
jgi:hypothetical protein